MVSVNELERQKWKRYLSATSKEFQLRHRPWYFNCNDDEMFERTRFRLYHPPDNPMLEAYKPSIKKRELGKNVVIDEHIDTAIYAIKCAREIMPDSEKRKMLKLISKWLYILRGN